MHVNKYSYRFIFIYIILYIYTLPPNVAIENPHHFWTKNPMKTDGRIFYGISPIMTFDMGPSS